MYKFILKATLYLLIISYIFDPTGELFQLRYISTIIATLVLGLKVIFNVQKRNISYVQLFYLFLFCLVIPVYGLSITFLQSFKNNIIDTSYIGFSLSLILLIPVLFLEKSEFYNAFIRALRVLKFLVFLILVSFMINMDQAGISQFFINHKSMLVGFREYAGISTYYLYFTSSPLLIILVAHDCYNLLLKYSFNKVLLFVSSAIAVFLTGTRYNMLFALIILPVSIIIRGFSWRYFGVYLIFFILFFSILLGNSFIGSFFNSTENSNSVKTGYIEYYLQLLNSPGILFGQGFNAAEWSMPFKNLLEKSDNSGVKTELTYFEIIRVFGLWIGFFINVAILFTPILIYKNYKQIDERVIGIFFYLISAMFNPYIFSTNGILVFLLILTSISKRALVDNLPPTQKYA